MPDVHQVLALIPARGGSKGIPRKNLVPLAGLPLIAHTIRAALGAPEISRVIVSTEDQEIADISRSYGAEVPFLRPAALARDDTPSYEVVKHALGWLAQNQNYRPTELVLLQPTSPLRQACHIQAALEIFRAGNHDSVVSVTLVDQHPFWMFSLNDERTLEPFIKEHPSVLRRQDLPPLYRLNGAVYVTSPHIIFTTDGLVGRKIGAYVMPEELSLDIDQPKDLIEAEASMEWLKKASAGNPRKG